MLTYCRCVLIIVSVLRSSLGIKNVISRSTQVIHWVSKRHSGASVYSHQNGRTHCISATWLPKFSFTKLCKLKVVLRTFAQKVKQLGSFSSAVRQEFSKDGSSKYNTILAVQFLGGGILSSWSEWDKKGIFLKVRHSPGIQLATFTTPSIQSSKPIFPPWQRAQLSNTFTTLFKTNLIRQPFAPCEFGGIIDFLKRIYSEARNMGNAHYERAHVRASTILPMFRNYAVPRIRVRWKRHL
jgi:hypothetical protein